MINVITPEVRVEKFDTEYIIKKIERCARTCYKTEDSKAPIGDLLNKRLLKGEARGLFFKEIKDSFWKEDEDIAQRLLKQSKEVLSAVHSSVLEHSNISVKFITNRGMTHELVRHRIGVAFSQESTRYCNYSKDKFGNSITVIKPYYCGNEAKHMVWTKSMDSISKDYFKMLDVGCIAEEAREVLSNSTKTEIVLTANINAWRHILSLRSTQKAHPEIRRSMAILLQYLYQELPILFADIYYKTLYHQTNFPGIEDVRLNIVDIDNF